MGTSPFTFLLYVTLLVVLCMVGRAYNCWSWVPVVGPLTGGVLGALIYMAGVGTHAHQHHLGQPVSQ